MAAAPSGWRAYGPGVAGLGFAALAAPSLAWHQGVIAGVGGLLGLLLPLPWARLPLAIGLAAAALPAEPSVRVAVAVGALVLHGLGRLADADPLGAVDPARFAADARLRRTLRAAGALAVSVGMVLAAKQQVAARALAAAEGTTGDALALGLAAGAGLLAASALPFPAPARPREGNRGVSVHAGGDQPAAMERLRAAMTGPSPLAVALLLVGVAAGARLARLGTLLAPTRLVAAEEIDAVNLVYTDVLAAAASPKDPATLVALVKAAPDRDEAALALGWEAALKVGWRPARAEGVVIPVARALEAGGRGGEALRLLARQPREGEVDGLRALFERTQGLPVAWKGGAVGTALSLGSRTELLAAPIEFTHDDARTLEITAPTALGVESALTLDCDGTAFEGPPVLALQWDAGAVQRVECPAQGWGEALDLAAGPHRLRVAFVNDAAGPEGDRNVRLSRVAIVPAEDVFGPPP